MMRRKKPDKYVHIPHNRIYSVPVSRLRYKLVNLTRHGIRRKCLVPVSTLANRRSKKFVRVLTDSYNLSLLVGRKVRVYVPVDIRVERWARRKKYCAKWQHRILFGSILQREDKNKQSANLHKSLSYRLRKLRKLTKPIRNSPVVSQARAYINRKCTPLYYPRAFFEEFFYEWCALFFDVLKWCYSLSLLLYWHGFISFLDHILLAHVFFLIWCFVEWCFAVAAYNWDGRFHRGIGNYDYPGFGLGRQEVRGLIRLFIQIVDVLIMLNHESFQEPAAMLFFLYCWLIFVVLLVQAALYFFDYFFVYLCYIVVVAVLLYIGSYDWLESDPFVVFVLTKQSFPVDWLFTW